MKQRIYALEMFRVDNKIVARSNNGIMWHLHAYKWSLMYANSVNEYIWDFSNKCWVKTDLDSDTDTNFLRNQNIAFEVLATLEKYP